jgi:hypothetical protein
LQCPCRRRTRRRPRGLTSGLSMYRRAAGKVFWQMGQFLTDATAPPTFACRLHKTLLPGSGCVLRVTQIRNTSEGALKTPNVYMSPAYTEDGQELLAGNAWARDPAWAVPPNGTARAAVAAVVGRRVRRGGRRGRYDARRLGGPSARPVFAATLNQMPRPRSHCSGCCP